jgi:hypothetical protein
MVVGDVHRDFAALNALMNKKPIDIVLQCGDFGYWPRDKPENVYGRYNPNYPKDLPAPKVPEGCEVYWVDGNHEDHEILLQQTELEIWPRAFYQPRGSHILLPDGRRVLFIGGAASHDKQFRTPGYDWFPEEIITQKDLDNIDFSLKYDIVISHTCPKSFGFRSFMHLSDYRDTDPCETALDIVYHEVKPDLWFFGHWHRNKTGYTDGTRWTTLDHTSGHSPWWQWLPE